jgi:AcrR family transcriptional regulator
MRADARRSHDAIPAAAGDLFAGRGSEVQMDEIAGRAGVGIGTMCRHFAAKQALGGDAAPVAVQAEVDAGTRSGVTSEELAEIKSLKAKVRRLEEDNAILKAATVVFAGELDPRNR